MSSTEKQKIVFSGVAPCLGVIAGKRRAALYAGDCLDLIKRIPDESVDLIVSSPPYCIGKEYEPGAVLSDFVDLHRVIFPELVRALKPGGSICWQVGSHVKDSVVTPLDYLVFAEAARHPDLRLRNRIVWSFGHGLHCSNRFSGRHETILWYSKGDSFTFQLDAVRVPQKYPGKTHVSGPRKGLPSGNPLGKNPGDVWEIPNVKAKHVEKTEHPCQFPVALPQRLVRALTTIDGVVMDPFAGSASTGVAALIEGRRFVGAELNKEYANSAGSRLALAIEGVAPVRPWDKEVFIPDSSLKVARMPPGYFNFEGQMSPFDALVTFE